MTLAKRRRARSPGRSYGSGSLVTRTTKTRGDVWFGKWRDDGRQIMREIGPKRRHGSSDGSHAATLSASCAT